jgi:hypothetical protein
LALFVSRGCPHCQALTAAIAELDGLPGVGLAVFSRDEITPDDPHLESLRRHAVPYFAEPAAFERFHIRSVPLAVWCDATGTVLATQRGGDIAALRALVTAPPSGA